MSSRSARTHKHLRFLTRGAGPRGVAKLTAKQTRLKDLRNKLAARHALMRGETRVTLLWDDKPSISLINYVRERVAYDDDAGPQFSFGPGYGHFWNPRRGMVTEAVPDLLPRQLARKWPGETTWDGFRLRMRKILGQGGFGVASLWEAVFEDGKKRRVVLKMPLPGRGEIQDELSWHERYFGASHVVQAIDLNRIVERKRAVAGSASRERIRGERFCCQRLNVLVLEYVKYGTFFDLMARASYYRTNFNNKVLWQIWDCREYRPLTSNSPSTPG